MTHSLLLPPGWDSGALAPWNQTLLAMLVKSGLFIPREEPAMAFNLSSSPRRKHINALGVDGRVLLLDTWDTDDPLSEWWAHGGRLGGHSFDLAIKVQWQPGNVTWADMELAGLPVRPWTIFPCSQFPCGYFEWSLESCSYIGAITGERRWGRGAYADEAARMGDVFVGAMGRWKSRTPWESYLRVTRGCRWGISLGGRKGTDKKNRREAEYASCGMPLALNYEPHYPFDYRPGIEYFLLRKPADLALLRDIDPRPYAEASRELWRRRFSPVGAARTLLELIERELP